MDTTEQQSNKRSLSDLDTEDPSNNPGEIDTPRVEFVIRQGLNEDPNSLRANDRTARMLVETHCASEADAAAIHSLLLGERRDGAGWARLTFELCHAPEGEVALLNHNKHSEHIDVMEPSGASHTRRKINESKFTMDSRAHKDKRVAGGARSFYSGLHLESTLTESCIMSECKFSTNITSRQHDRKNFIWKATLAVSIDGEKIVEASAQTVEFEYVARRLKPKGAPRKKSSSTEPYTARKKVRPEPRSDSDSDEGTFEEVPEPIRRPRRSTRKAAAACRAALPQMMVNEHNERAEPAARSQMMELNDEPSPPLGYHAGQIGGMLVKRVSPYDENVSSDALFRTSSTKALEETMLRQPTKGGLNLSRVESIDRLCEAFAEDALTNAGTASHFTTPTIVPQNDPSSLALSRNGDGSSRHLLSRCRSDIEDGVGLQLDRANPNSGSLEFTRESRGMGSTWSLFSIGEDELLSSMEDSSTSTMGDGGAMLINA